MVRVNGHRTPHRSWTAAMVDLASERLQHSDTPARRDEAHCEVHSARRPRSTAPAPESRMRITTRFRPHRAVVVAGCALAAYALSACTAPDNATGDTADAAANGATTAAVSTDPAQARGAIDSTNAANASAFARGDS